MILQVTAIPITAMLIVEFIYCVIKLFIWQTFGLISKEIEIVTDACGHKVISIHPVLTHR